MKTKSRAWDRSGLTVSKAAECSLCLHGWVSVYIRMCVCMVSMHKHECIHRYLYVSLLKTWILTQLTMWTNSCWPRNENCQNADNLKWELCNIKENCQPALYQKPLGNPPKKNYLLIWGWRPGRPVLSLSTRPMDLVLPSPASSLTLRHLPAPCWRASFLVTISLICRGPGEYFGKWIWGPGSYS